MALHRTAIKSAIGYIVTLDSASTSFMQHSGGLCNVTVPRRKLNNGKQLQLFVDSEPDPSQAGPHREPSRREAVPTVDDLRPTQTLLGLALSSDYAARQKASLVGQNVASNEDFTVLPRRYCDSTLMTF